MEKISIATCLSRIEDPRSRSGRRFELGPILNLIVVGLLCGHLSLTRIAQYGRTLPTKTRMRIGFDGDMPCVATLSNILKVIDPQKADKQLSFYTLGGKKLLDKGKHVAIDGKSIRGAASGGSPIVHLLSLFVTDVHGVLNQKRMNAGENEISCGLQLLQETQLEGAIITGDAIFAQKKNLSIAC